MYADDIIWVRNDDDKTISRDLDVPTTPYAIICDEDGITITRGIVSDVYSILGILKRGNVIK